MRYYFAPLEGLTDGIYRRVHHKHFSGVDRYFMPFLSPTMHHNLTHKEDRELPMADSMDFDAVPQILSNVPEDFLWAAEQCARRGYTEVNLNVGCPSGTVVAKGKGAGMLADPEALDRFLEAVFSGAAVNISVKTRVGITQEDEFPRLMEIFNQYPICELTVHPRVRKDFYNTSVRMAAFDYAVNNSRVPLCYNGDLCTPGEIRDFQARYPEVKAVMIGRGLIGDPALLQDTPLTASALEGFHNELLETYIQCFGSARNAMFRMKENWRYFACRFHGGEKLFKALKKTTDITQFQSLTTQIFRTLPLRDCLTADWKAE